MILYRVVKWMEQRDRLKALFIEINRLLPDLGDRPRLWETLLLQGAYPADAGAGKRAPANAAETEHRVLSEGTADGSTPKVAAGAEPDTVPVLPEWAAAYVPNEALPDFTGVSAQKICEFLAMKTVISGRVAYNEPAEEMRQPTFMEPEAVHTARGEQRYAPFAELPQDVGVFAETGDGPVWIAVMRTQTPTEQMAEKG